MWGEDGSIYFVPNVYVPVSRIPAAGGVAQPVTTILMDAGEVQHRWPELLPGGKVLLYVAGLGSAWVEALIVAQLPVPELRLRGPFAGRSFRRLPVRGVGAPGDLPAPGER